MKYAKSFGKTSTKPEHAKPFQLDTFMWMASFTKLMTSVCAMQLVEQGKVALDEPVYKHIPELASLPILTGIDESTGKPIEEENTTPITLRHLLTHTSGITYDILHPFTVAWLKYHKMPGGASGKLLERFAAPLIFAPGTGWAYGPSTDYAGLLVERVSGKRLEAYMQEHLWAPLGIKEASFHPSIRADLQGRLADMGARTPDGRLTHFEGPFPWADGEGKEMEGDHGGHGSFSTAEEYGKFVHAVLTSDENERLLKKSTVEELFKPQLGEESRAALNAVLQIDWVCARFLLLNTDLMIVLGQQHHGWNAEVYDERLGLRWIIDDE